MTGKNEDKSDCNNYVLISSIGLYHFICRTEMKVYDKNDQFRRKNDTT